MSGGILRRFRFTKIEAVSMHSKWYEKLDKSLIAQMVRFDDCSKADGGKRDCFIEHWADEETKQAELNALWNGRYNV